MSDRERVDLPDAAALEFLYALSGEDTWAAEFLQGQFRVVIADLARPDETGFMHGRWYVQVSHRPSEPPGDCDDREELMTWGAWHDRQPSATVDSAREAAEFAARSLMELAAFRIPEAVPGEGD